MTLFLPYFAMYQWIRISTGFIKFSEKYMVTFMILKICGICVYKSPKTITYTDEW